MEETQSIAVAASSWGSLRSIARRWAPAGLVVLGIALAVLGQWSISGHGLSPRSLALFASGGALFVGALLVTGLGQLESTPQERAEPPPTPPFTCFRVLLVGLAAGLAALAYAFSGNNAFTAVGVTSWVAALVLCWTVFRPTRHEENPRSRIEGSEPGRLTRRSVEPFAAGLVLLGIIGVAAFFRFYQLAAIPVDMYSDQVENVLDVERVLSGKFPIFFPTHGGREPIVFYLTAGLSWLFRLDVNFLTLKLVPALASLALVPIMYFLGLEIFGRRTPALLAASFVAAAHWPVMLGRCGLRVTLGPLVAAVALLFLFRALNRGHRSDFLVCGLFVGLGLYSYMSLRILPVAVAACLLWRLAALVRGRRWFEAREHLLQSSILVITALIVFIPMARFMLDEPDAFWRRGTGLLGLSEEFGQETPMPEALGAIPGNLKNLILMFNWRGDEMWAYQVPLTPVADYVVAALLPLAVVATLVAVARKPDRPLAYVLICAFLLLLPSALIFSHTHENPNLARASAAIPLVFALAAWPAAHAGEQLARALGRTLGPPLAGVGLAGLIATVAVLNYHYYFEDYAERYARSVPNASELANVIKAFEAQGGSREDAWIIYQPHWFDGRAVAIELGQLDWERNIVSLQEAQRHPSTTRRALYLLHPSDQEARLWLQRAFPEGRLKRFESSRGQDFFVFTMRPLTEAALQEP